MADLDLDSFFTGADMVGGSMAVGILTNSKDGLWAQRIPANEGYGSSIDRLLDLGASAAAFQTDVLRVVRRSPFPAARVTFSENVVSVIARTGVITLDLEAGDAD